MKFTSKESVILYDKRDFEGMIKAKDAEMGRLFYLIRLGPISPQDSEKWKKQGEEESQKDI
jgi:hypothetical protein